MNSRDSQNIKVVVWGASGHAAVVADAIRLQGGYEVIGFLDSINPERRGEVFCGAEILGGREQLPRLRGQDITHVALGFGDCLARIELGDSLVNEGFTLVNVQHPKGTVARSATIGHGTVILAGAVVDPTCQIGDYCIVNNNSTVSHHSIIGRGVHICPGVHVGGRVSIGAASWIGIGSCIVDRITIGSGSFVGAGAVVVKDIPSGVLAYGNPARVVGPVTKSVESYNAGSYLDEQR